MYPGPMINSEQVINTWWGWVKFWVARIYTMTMETPVCSVHYISYEFYGNKLPLLLFMFVTCFALNLRLFAFLWICWQILVIALFADRSFFSGGCNNPTHTLCDSPVDYASCSKLQTIISVHLHMRP